MKPMKPRPPGSAVDALVRFFAEIGTVAGHDATAGAKVSANFLGVSDSYIRKASDPDQPEDLGFRRVAMLTEHFRARAAAEHLALLAGGLFVPLPAGDASGRFASIGAAASVEFGEAMAELFKAVSAAGPGGQEITAAERRRLAAEIDDVLRVFAELRGMVIPPDAPET